MSQGNYNFDPSAADENSHRLSDAISQLGGLVGAPGFVERARSIQALFNTLRPMSRRERENLWAQYQAAWEDQKAANVHQRAESEEARRQMESTMYIDTSPDGELPGGIFGLGDWKGMGAKLMAAKTVLDEIDTKIRGDQRLLPEHRHALFQKLHDKRYELQQKRELTWSTLYDEAASLYNEAYYAVGSMDPREALEVFKKNQTLALTLYLRRPDKEKLSEWFQELWQKLQFRFEERRRDYEQRKAEWTTRQETGLHRLLEAREKTMAFLERTEQNIEANRDRLASARSSEWSDRFSDWIREGEDKLEDVRRSLDDLNRKIDDAGTRLRR